MLIILIVAVALILLTAMVLIKKPVESNEGSLIPYKIHMADAEGRINGFKSNIQRFKHQLSLTSLGTKMSDGIIDIDWEKRVVIKGTFALYTELNLLAVKLAKADTYDNIHHDTRKEYLNLIFDSEFKEKMFEYIKYREVILGKDSWDSRKNPPSNIKERLFLRVRRTSRTANKIKYYQIKIDAIKKHLDQIDVNQFKFSDAQAELNAIIHGETL